MNYKNWDDYENELVEKMIEEEYFKKKSKIKCKNSNCQESLERLEQTILVNF